jgi:beta-lactamase regulating signal transducer with metallopeptidase domain
MNLADESLGWLVSASVRGGLSLILVALVVALIPQRRAGLRHFVWALGVGQVALLTFLVPFVPAWHTDLLPAHVLPAGGFSVLTIAASAPVATPAAQLSSPVVQAAVASAGDGAPAGLTSVSLVLGLWALGAALLLLRRLGSWRAARAQIRAARPIDDPQLLVCLAERAQSLGIARPPALRQSVDLSVPVIAGILRPVLLLPADAVSWPASLQRSVFTHELAHVRRQDLAIQLVADLVRAFHWPNPLVWFAAARLLVERERAADDCVLAGGAKQSDYAGHLLTLAQAGRGQPVLAAGASMVGRSQLSQRLERMLKRPLAGVRGAGLGFLRRRTALVLALVAAASALPVACLDGAEAPTGPATRLTYAVKGDQLEDTAAVLARRLDMLGLKDARVSRSAGGLIVDVPALPVQRRGEVKRTLAASGRLRLVLVDSDADYSRRLADFARNDSGAVAAGIKVNTEMWRREGASDVHDIFLEGRLQPLTRFLATLPSSLRPPAGHQVVLDRKGEGDNVRTLYLDLGRSVSITRVVDAKVFRQPGRDDDWFEVNVGLQPADGAQLEALTRTNLGLKLAVLFDEDDLWGAPTIQSPISTRLSVTARGSRAEADQLAAGFRAGGLPAPLELLTEDLRSSPARRSGEP